MAVGTDRNSPAPAETIHRAVHIATSATLVSRQSEQADEIFAESSEALRLISAFTQIEDVAVRGMLLQVTQVLADTLSPA